MDKDLIKVLVTADPAAVTEYIRAQTFNQWAEFALIALLVTVLAAGMMAFIGREFFGRGDDD